MRMRRLGDSFGRCGNDFVWFQRIDGGSRRETCQNGPNRRDEQQLSDDTPKLLVDANRPTAGCDGRALRTQPVVLLRDIAPELLDNRMANRRLNGKIGIPNGSTPTTRISVTRPKPSDEDEEKKEMAEAAFREWLKRKAAEPHTPRAEQISLHLKEDARHRVYNNWLHSRRFTQSPHSNGETTPSDNPSKTFVQP
ncbi:hypothetical protein Q1695_001337 [Nippostrongylus brasiliensis]|nr:hypothetical protein Q1695_001337 [Nippostrongylus brasiliensis]